MSPIRFTNAFTHMRRLRRHEFVLIYPAREWTLGLLLGIVLLTIGGVHAAYTFTHTAARAVGEGQASSESASLPYNALDIKKTLQFYEDRARAFEDLRGVTPPPSDVVIENLEARTGEDGEGEVPQDVPPDAVPVAE